eukprot:gene24475-26283_t
MADGADEIDLLNHRFPAPPSGRDWWLVLSQLRDKLKLICEDELVKSDPECQAIIGRMAAASSMVEIDQGMDELGLRVGQLLLARGQDVSELLKFGVGQRRKGRASLDGSGAMLDGLVSDAGVRPARTRLKL